LTRRFDRSKWNEFALYALRLFVPENEAAMPAWLEVLLNLVGYAGFLALATRRTSRTDTSRDDHICGDRT
jgi:hypothetical protein